MLTITVHQKGARLDSVKELVEAAIKSKYPQATVHVTREQPAESRADRFVEAQSSASDAKSTAEELRDELQEWRDGLPENLQSGSKADELDDAISSLEEFIEAMDTAEGVDVSFPGMY